MMDEANPTDKSWQRKQDLLEILSATAVSDRDGPVSLRQFAIRAGVSEPTLRHHFGDRRGVVIAILNYFAQQADPFLTLSAQSGETLEEAISGYTQLALGGFENALFIQAHAFALVESIHDPEVARAYLEIIIEPSLRAIETRLQPHLSSKGYDENAIRHAALCLYSPSLFTALHQTLLKGQQARPLDMNAFMSNLSGWLSQGLESKTD